MAWHMHLIRLGFTLDFCCSVIMHGVWVQSLFSLEKKLTGHLTGHLTGLTGFCPDHANNHLLKSCHHACLAVGALELEMGQPWF